MNKSIGIYGGSFNPIHTGHISLAKLLIKNHSLDEIWFVVSPLNPFKTAATDLLEDDVRLEMTRIALEKEDRLVACDYEFHLSKPSYMWNTLRHLSADYPEFKFTLIIGADNWVAFDRWYHAGDILDNYDVLVYPRQDSPIDRTTMPVNVKLTDTPLFNISSTEIRNRINRGESLKGLVPENIIPLVEEYYR
jgi:nicotinate-nucleotide adenylyltransferase